MSRLSNMQLLPSFAARVESQREVSRMRQAQKRRNSIKNRFIRRRRLMEMCQSVAIAQEYLTHRQ